MNYLTTLEKPILSILINHPSARDDDIVLYAWLMREMRYSESKTAYDFLRDMRDGNIPNMMSVSRARRKVQKEKPSLRGKKYKGRQEAAKKAAEFFAPV